MGDSSNLLFDDHSSQSMHTNAVLFSFRSLELQVTRMQRTKVQANSSSSWSALVKSLTSGEDGTDLVRHIARTNLLVVEVVTKLGLLNRWDVAWRFDKYYDLWVLLRDDYELEGRLHALQMKVMCCVFCLFCYLITICYLIAITPQIYLQPGRQNLL